MSTVSSFPSDPDQPRDAAAHFAARLRFETDPSDVYTAQKQGDAVTLIDVRSDEAWRQGRIPGALHMPYAEMPERALAELAPLLREAMARRQVSGTLHDGLWLDVGTVERLEAARRIAATWS